MWYGMTDYEFGLKFYEDGYESDITPYGKESRSNGNFDLVITSPNGERWVRDFNNVHVEEIAGISDQAISHHRRYGGQPEGFHLCR